MVRAFTTVLAQVIITTTVFALNVLILSLAGVLRLLPTAVPLLGRALWGLLVLSCRLYYLLLTRLAPGVQAHLRVNLLSGLWRMSATVVLSLLLGAGLLLIVQVEWSGWLLAACLLHGVFVSLVWDEIPDTGGLQLGAKLS